MVPDSQPDLGKLIAVHGIAPAYIQRAVFIAVLSFSFFLAMMFALYLRQDIGYFFLSSVFLVIYLLMMFSWIIKRRSVVEIHENGVKYGKNSAAWEDVATISDDGVIERKDNTTFVLPKSLNNWLELVSHIRTKSCAIE